MLYLKAKVFVLMSKQLGINKIKATYNACGSVDFFIYYLKGDRVKLSTTTKRLLGLSFNTPCTISTIKSLIIGIDVPKFLQQFEKWLKGDTEGFIQIRVVDAHNHMRTIQIKGRVRYNSKGEIHSVYGAYFDIAQFVN